MEKDPALFAEGFYSRKIIGKKIRIFRKAEVRRDLQLLSEARLPHKGIYILHISRDPEVKIFVEGLCRRFAVLGGRHDKAAEVLYLRRDPQGLKKKCRSGFVQLRARHVLIHPRLHHLFPFFSDLFFKAIIDLIVLAPGKTEDR